MKKFDTIAALIEKGFRASVTDLGVEVIEREYRQSYKMSTGRVIDCFMRVMVVIPNRDSDVLRVLYQSSYGFKDVTYTNTKRAFNAIRANIIREGYDFDAPAAVEGTTEEVPAEVTPVERIAEEGQRVYYEVIYDIPDGLDSNTFNRLSDAKRLMVEKGADFVAIREWVEWDETGDLVSLETIIGDF